MTCKPRRPSSFITGSRQVLEEVVVAAEEAAEALEAEEVEAEAAQTRPRYQVCSPEKKFPLVF